MSSLNQKAEKPYVSPLRTHEGGPAVRGSALHELRRTTMASLLWENGFYESGVSVADRVKSLVAKCAPEDVFHLAVEARQEMFLRHVPLLLARELARGTPDHRKFTRRTLAEIVRRPDELSEFLAIYWGTENKAVKRTNNEPMPKRKSPLANGVKRGLADAFKKFNAFQLSKWDRKDKAVRLRDVMFLTHPKPKDGTQRWTKAERKADKARGGRDWEFSPQEEAFFLTAQDLLKQTETWEARMSGGEDPKIVFEDLMAKSELGGMAFIRNLRKMDEAAVDKDLIKQYGSVVNLRGILPHQLITAARVNPGHESMIDAMILRTLDGMEKLPGKTVVLVDVSGSMDVPLSHVKHRYTGRANVTSIPETTRIDAACGVAIMARELCEDCEVFSFSNTTVRIPARHGMALRDAIMKSQPFQGTDLHKAVADVNRTVPDYERIIVITDEQSNSGIGAPLLGTKAYVMNVANEQNGVNFKNKWLTITGWSPQVLRYINAYEKE